MTTVEASVTATPRFLHEAFFYADDAEYLAGTVPFIQEGLDLAFADVPAFKLLCPYDIGALGAPVIEEAHRNHPHIGGPGVSAVSERFDGRIPAWIDTPLAPVPAAASLVDFDAGGLGAVRRQAAAEAAAAGMPPSRIEDLLVAVSEAVTNSLRHGGGAGQVLLWHEDTQFFCEIRDRGLVSDPLAGRRRPGVDQPSGRGLWLMHQLCDLVQIRALPDGQVVRLHVLI